jgi:hypothetical protein
MRIVNLSEGKIIEKDITLEEPTRIQGGAYFTKINYNGGVLFIQTPIIDTKNGVIESSKSNYIDLIFENDNAHLRSISKDKTAFLENFQDLERVIKGKIKDNVSKWFDNNMTQDDIEYFYNDTIKTGKNNKLLRSHLNKQDNILIFDKDENIKTLGDIKGNKIISILEIKGVQITTTTFILKTVVKQLMIFKEENNFTKCLIERSKTLEQDIKGGNTTIEPQGTNETLILDEGTIDINDIQGIKTRDNTMANTIVQEEEDINEIEEEHGIQPLSIDDKLDTIDKKDSKDSKYNSNISDTGDEDIDYENVNKMKERKGGGKINDKINDKNNDRKHDNNKSIMTKSKSKSKITTIPVINDKEKPLEEFIIEIDDNDKNNENNNIKLRKPNEAYYELYREKRNKAKKAKKIFITAYLEAKNIKNTYLLDDLDDDDSESDNMSDFDDASYTDDMSFLDENTDLDE